jgi:hypothetical protein
LLNTVDHIDLDKTKLGLHSLRSGGATAAAAAQVEDRLFKKHGRWKSEKAIKDGYVKENLSPTFCYTKTWYIKHAHTLFCSKLCCTRLGELFP